MDGRCFGLKAIENNGLLETYQIVLWSHPFVPFSLRWRERRVVPEQTSGEGCSTGVR